MYKYTKVTNSVWKDDEQNKDEETLSSIKKYIKSFHVKKFPFDTLYSNKLRNEDIRIVTLLLKRSVRQ